MLKLKAALSYFVSLIFDESISLAYFKNGQTFLEIKS